MAFKMTGMNFGKGTGSALLKNNDRITMSEKDLRNIVDSQKKKSGSSEPFSKTSPMKQEKTAYGGTRTWTKGKEASAKHGEDLSSLVKERAKHKKGSKEYNILQNKINQALGSKKRHDEGATRSSSTEKKDKVVYKDEEKGTKDKIKTTYHDPEKTKIKKEKVVTKGPEGDTKTVVKYDEEGNVIGERGYDTTKKDDKKDKKKFKETKVGQFLGAGGKEARQKRRAEREQKRAKKKGKILKEDKAFVQEKEGKTWTQTGGFGETDESGKQVWEWVPNKKSKKSDPFSKKYTYKK